MFHSTEASLELRTMAGYTFCFQKELTPTDISRNLEIPEWALDLPPGNESMHVVDPNADITWEFICSTRSSGRRSMTHQWIDFAKKKELRPGDVLRFYRWTNGDGYFMVLERHSIRLFGVTIYLSKQVVSSVFDFL
ncbi:unnamed protein product [Ilex paraguariensis]|uniref:TF-B3 domain-containing protein n=1 Tax=Ilex paraguariensis TaxID=185542 RepID=A0ABC8SS56_9AQUA